MIMNNYCSMGVDALVTLHFHRQRESKPWLFAHRLINKVLSWIEAGFFSIKINFFFFNQVFICFTHLSLYVEITSLDLVTRMLYKEAIYIADACLDFIKIVCRNKTFIWCFAMWIWVSIIHFCHHTRWLNRVVL